MKLRNIGLVLALCSLGCDVDDVNFSYFKSQTAPIYIFSSALSFVLTLVLTRDIWYSIVAIVIILISLKKPKFKWMYITFGIVVSFSLLLDNSPFYNNLLILTVSFLYAMSSLVIEYLKIQLHIAQMLLCSQTDLLKKQKLLLRTMIR